jgi:Excalibur calcium-binding domain
MCNPPVHENAWNLGRRVGCDEMKHLQIGQTGGNGGRDGESRILPYKQEAAGSNPAPPTRESPRKRGLFSTRRLSGSPPPWHLEHLLSRGVALRRLARNGRITGLADVPRSNRLYELNKGLDRDKDRVACEKE